MPRPLQEQTVVITGASSGIGREAALLFGRRGARVVLAARDEPALREVAAEVERDGGQALVVPTDVADWPQVERLAHAAVDRLGRIDTWVNNAGITLGGLVEDTDVDEAERLIRVNVLGPFFGVKAALPHMRRQGGGTIINVSSVAGVRAFPLQTIYSATKHALKGFTEGLRLELQREGGDVHVTLILPTSINTPLFTDARTKTGARLGAPPPVYEPDVVAESIVFAAEHPRRDIFVGGAAKTFDVLERISPPLVDWILTRDDWIFRKQVSDRPDGGPGNLFEPPPGPRSVRGDYSGQARPTSLYTRTFEWHPWLKPALLGAAALGVAALVRGRGSDRRDGPVHRLRHAARKALDRLS